MMAGFKGWATSSEPPSGWVGASMETTWQPDPSLCPLCIFSSLPQVWIPGAPLPSSPQANLYLGLLPGDSQLQHRLNPKPRKNHFIKNWPLVQCLYAELQES